MATGMAAIGVAFASIGAAVGAAASYAVITGVIVSAVAGAAVGGLIAAVTGGDIEKGILFGAIGGVVSVGVSGLVSGAIGGTAGAVEGAQVAGTIPTTVHGGAISQNFITPTVAGQAGGSALGSLGTGLTSQLVGAGLDFAIAGMAEDVEMPFAQTEEGFYAQLESAEKRQEMASEKQEVPYMEMERERTQSALNQISLQNAGALEKQEKEYALALDKSSKEYKMANEKFSTAADITADTQFQGSSQAAKDAVIAKQQGAEPVGMLQGAPVPEEVA